MTSSPWGATWEGIRRVLDGNQLTTAGAGGKSNSKGPASVELKIFLVYEGFIPAVHRPEL